MRGRGRGTTGGSFGRGGSSALGGLIGIPVEDSRHGAVSLAPPPLYPSLETKPLPLTDSAQIQYCAEVKQELFNRFQESPFYLRSSKISVEKDIVRYTDKYHQMERDVMSPKWTRLPKELRWNQMKRKKKITLPPPAKKPRTSYVTEIEANLLQDLEHKESSEQAVDSDDGKEKPEEEQGKDQKQLDEEQLSDDEVEEENDYIQSYFDNGDGYLDESEDNIDDDATY